MQAETLLKTPLHGAHVQMCAKMVPFGGWDMPVQYEKGIIEEHRHTREFVSLFDTCHMGEFRISGAEAAIALDRIFPRAVADQKVGTARYNFLLSDQGTVMDDLLIYRMDDDEFLLVVNAGTIATDAARLKELLPQSISFVDESDKTGKLDLQGPGTADVLEKMGFQKSELPKNYRWIKKTILGVPVLMSRTGYTGELGYEFYMASDKVEKIWNAFLEYGEVKPAGLGARDTLRLEVGYPLYGNEMDENTTPVEAGFSPILKLDKRGDFIGSDILKDTKKVTKNLIAIVLEGRRAARHGSTVLSSEGSEIGEVTSGMFSPLLEKAIALAYITPEISLNEGDSVTLKVGRSELSGEIVSLPFYKNGSVRQKLS